MEAELKSIIDKYDVITFDIFDTLIKRNCYSLTDIWKMVETLYCREENKNIGFVKMRYNAEIQCYRDKVCPTIDMIYDKIEIDSQNREKLKKIEYDIEYKLCVANKKIYDIYKYCMQKNKKIYAISDMYFSEEFLKKILKKNGYEIQKIWVSCEKKCNKSSGMLFEKFISDTGVKKENILHIGDNIKADKAGAKKAGINSILIKKDICNLKYTDSAIKKGDVEDKFLYSLMNNRIDFCDNRIEQIGYETLGPLLVGFCQWLHRQKMEKKIDVFMFCARDVKQTMDMYKDMYPEDEIRYLCVSLKSLKTPYEYSIGIDKSEYAHEQYDNIRTYLMQLGCKGRVAMVDSGCGGHTQNMIRTILGDMCEFHGLYMRISKQFYKNVNDRQSGPFMFKHRPSAKSYISGAFFETMLSATHGRTLSYKKNDDIVEPVFGEPNPQMEKLETFQKGIWQFYEDWKEYVPMELTIKPESIQQSFLNFSFFPLREDVELMSQITGGNEEYGEIVIDNIKKGNFLKNLKETYWKGGYLCARLKRYKLFCKLYLILDEMILNIIGF